MNKRFARYIVFLLLNVVLVLTGNPLHASDVSVTDTMHVAVRLPAKDFAKAFKAEKAFIYTKPSPKESFLARLLEFLNNKLQELAKISFILPWVVKILFAGLVIFLLIIVITKTKLYKVFYSGNPIQNPDFEIASAGEEPPDLDEAIRTQVEQKQFRLAIRLLYIKIINQLRIKEFIRYSQEKTNIDYLRELSNKELKSDFANVTSIYNHVWYGDVEIAEDQFLKFEKSFQSLFLAVDVSK